MERDSLKHSEFNPLPQEADTTSSGESDKKKKKKSQPETERIWSKHDTTEAKVETNRKQPETVDAWWRRIGETAKLPDDKEKAQTAETTDDGLDTLSQVETKEVAQTYVSARRQEIAQELSQQSDELVESTEAQAALAADIYLAAVEHSLHSDPELNIEAATNEAYFDTVRAYFPEGSAPASEPETPSEQGSNISEAVLDESPLYSRSAGPGGGDNGREPPYWQRNTFPPSGEGPTFNASGATAHATLETVIERDFAAERVAAVRGLLVGGIIGYLIGRRRGRIKTERRLIPIQEKLEQEVAGLYSTIAVKETQLRKLVAEKARASKTFQPEYRFAAEHRPPAETAPEMKAHPAEVIRPPKSAVEVLDRDHLLVAAEKIRIGETTLRKVYETGLISERGLRRAVTEYGKGGDIRRVMAEELLIKEIGFELDPNLRDRPLAPASPAPASFAPPPDMAALKIEPQTTLPSPDSSNPLPPPLPLPQRTVPPLLITANVAALIVLAVLFVILVITHL